MTERETEKADRTITCFGEVLTLDDVKEFFADKKISKICPACQFNERAVMLTGPETESAMAVVTRRAQKIKDTKYTTFESTEGSRELPVYGLWCENCGYVQLHTLGTLALWKTERRGSSEEQQ